MKLKKRDMTYNQLQNFMANKYNDYQNTSIYDSNYNYSDTEFSEEIYNEQQIKESKKDNNQKPF